MALTLGWTVAEHSVVGSKTPRDFAIGSHSRIVRWADDDGEPEVGDALNDLLEFGESNGLGSVGAATQLVHFQHVLIVGGSCQDHDWNMI